MGLQSVINFFIQLIETRLQRTNEFLYYSHSSHSVWAQKITWETHWPSSFAEVIGSKSNFSEIWSWRTDSETGHCAVKLSRLENCGKQLVERKTDVRLLSQSGSCSNICKSMRVFLSQFPVVTEVRIKILQEAAADAVWQIQLYFSPSFVTEAWCGVYDFLWL